ncbi:hypothetical protein ACEWY4_010482 [Coilia grayii]|uniref:NACHT domain-containing protein n=1 Tax=Coilia grayii TaxID=363190 RepID=A0ABD1K225_9TELE
MEDADPEDSVVRVLEQQRLSLVDVLSVQEPRVLSQLLELVKSPGAREQLLRLGSPTERAAGLVDYFQNVGPKECGRFLETVCMACEGIPMHLESQLMSVSGSVTGDIGYQTSTSRSTTVPSCVKRSRLDHIQNYTDATKSFLLQKHQRVTSNVVREVRLDETWVSLRRRIVSRGRDRAARLQATTHTASSDLQDSEEGSVEDRVAVTSLLKTSSQATVLLGAAGSGKTLLMYSLAQRWAQDAYPDLKLLFLLEFRQLNSISHPVSLRDLLFRFFLPANSDEQAEAVLSYIISNPEKVCFIFDGYDEFRDKFTNPRDLRDLFDPCRPIPMADLLSGLCSQKILPQCTLLVTCRPRDIADLFDVTGSRVGELLGFDREHIREYACHYFRGRDELLAEEAVRHLTSSRHLLAMCHVPALCHICCVCLDHLFFQDGAGRAALLPTTLTQVYFQILAAFLSRHASYGREAVHTGGVAITHALPKLGGRIQELGRLALEGLEESRIVFPMERLRPELAEFGTRTGLLYSVDLMQGDGSSQPGVSFMHLTMQEFLAALHLMTSSEVSEAQFKTKLTLKTRWTAKNEPKTVFTDSLQLYLCGFLASDCTPHLAQLAGGGAKQQVVQRRRSQVVRVLESFAGSATLSGPKVVELCRCTHESQDVRLAAKVGSRQSFELRNIRLTPLDLEALAFVASAAEESVALDFGGCSMEPECLALLDGCRNVEVLIFRSRKYNDEFAEALSAVIPNLQPLKRLQFINAKLTDAGADKLVQALTKCPLIEHVDLSNNLITDRCLKRMMDIFPKLSNLTTVLLGRNIYTWSGLFKLVEKTMNCDTLQCVLIKGASAVEKAEEVHQFSLHFISRQSVNNLKNLDQEGETSKTLVWTNYSLSATHLKALYNVLKHCPGLTKLDVSRNSLGNKGVKELLSLLPSLGSIQEVIISENGVDMDGMVLIADLLSTCPQLIQVDASHCGDQKLILACLPSKSKPTTAPRQTRSHRRSLDSNYTEQNTHHLRKTFRLVHSDIQPASMDRLCKALGKFPGMFDLDFSSGIFEDSTIDELVKNLPTMTGLQLLSLSHVQTSTDGALMLVRSLADCPRVQAVELRPRGEAFIEFLEAKAEQATCKFTQYKLTIRNVEELSGILEHCARISDLDLSSNLLRDEGVQVLMDWLPKLHIGRSVNLNDNGLTQAGALHLVNSISTCEKVVAVEVSLGDEERSLIHFKRESAQEKSLSLKECNFRAEHLQRLVEILLTCPRLVQLELSCNTLHSESLSILNSLAQLRSLRNLEMRKNGLCSEVIEKLFQHVSHHQPQWTIRIEERWMKGEAVVALVVGCINVNSNIQEIGVTNSLLTVSLTGNSSVVNHSLSLQRCGYSNNSVATGSALKSIRFANSDVRGHHLRVLEPVLVHSALLQEIDLHTEQSTEDEISVIVAALRRSPNLESISLSGYLISDEGAMELRSTFPSLPCLKHLKLSQCSGWSSSGAEDLVLGVAQCSSLEGLRLGHLVLPKAAMNCLAQGLRHMTSVRSLRLSSVSIETSTPEEWNTTVQPLMASLQGCTGMEQIELEAMRLGEWGVQELVKHIPTWTQLRHISLAENYMSDSAGETLLHSLAHCPALEELNLSKNRLGCASAVQLGKVLSHLTRLRVLNLSENPVTAEGAMSLSAGLTNLKHLTKLHLTAIGTPDLTSIADSLRHCTNIEDVSMAWNNCGDEVALKLAEVLPKCVKLRRLDLESNRIHVEGAKSLAESLRFSFTVEVVRLWRNPISRDEEHALRATEPRISFSPT